MLVSSHNHLHLEDGSVYSQPLPARKESNDSSGDVTQPFVTPLYRPGLNGPKSTAHEYLSFPLLLCLWNEGSQFGSVG